MAIVWPATHDVFDKLQEVKDKYHSNLGEVSVVVEFSDAKPFKANRLNLGNVRKFSCANKIWQKGDFDFCITIVGEVWQDILQGDEQHNAILDLHLTRIEPVCVPQIIVENKKRHTVKDEFGRIVFTEEQKLDKNGNPMWRIVPIDLGVLSQNIRRYGFWFEDLIEFGSVVTNISISGTSNQELSA